MALNNTTFASKLTANGQILYTKLVWENSQDCLFQIKLYESNCCWSGKFSSVNFAKLVEEPEEEYNNNVRLAFIENSKDIIFEFVSNLVASTSKLSWKKVFEDSTEMPYGFVELQLDETETKENFIDFLLDENKELKGILEVYDKKNTALSDKVEQCKRELEEFINEKHSLEASLYGKFVQILNEKKERIRLLEETIQNFD